MKQELIKPIIKVGNSAGVLLPREWLNGNAKIELIEKPLDLKADILGIIRDYLSSIIGVYVVGSYARNEQEKDSDVDVLVITENVNKRIKKGKYEIIYISKEEVERQLNENALPILPMIKEARAIINEGLIKEYAKWNLNKKNLKWHIETTKSAMKVVEASIKLSKEMKTEENDSSAYSLILRLRTLYIINCIRKNKIWSKKEFLKMVKDISGSLISYERYVSSKDKNTLSNMLPIEEAEKLMNYINKKVRELEKCLREKRD